MTTRRRKSDKISFKITIATAIITTLGTMLAFTWKLAVDQTVRKNTINANTSAIVKLEKVISANTEQINKLVNAVNLLVERNKLRAEKKKRRRKKK